MLSLINIQTRIDSNEPAHIQTHRWNKRYSFTQRSICDLCKVNIYSLVKESRNSEGEPESAEKAEEKAEEKGIAAPEIVDEGFLSETECTCSF